ncbi:MAG: hypothetical protein KatS3mg119_2054 [Rhodothalassiaceae bacterium]|nr:MAG: hypothetical protein KatS3mg119_2054 [Rhodothalassiaceae bacterium]
MMTWPSAEIVSLKPVGMPKVVQMLMQAYAAVPFGIETGIGRQ